MEKKHDEEYNWGENWEGNEFLFRFFLGSICVFICIGCAISIYLSLSIEP